MSIRLLLINIWRESGLQRMVDGWWFRGERSLGSRLIKPRGDSLRSSMYSLSWFVKIIFDPSGESVGEEAPVSVIALREGMDGKRVAEARVTISASTLRRLSQGEKLAILISTV